MTDSPQFSRQWSRPLRPEHYRAAARRQRQLLELIERYADATDVRGGKSATWSQRINSLSKRVRYSPAISLHQSVLT